MDRFLPGVAASSLHALSHVHVCTRLAARRPPARIHDVQHRQTKGEREAEPRRPSAYRISTALEQILSPSERPESRCSLCRRADVPEAHPIAQEHRQRNEAREPEEHGQELGAQDGELVVQLRLGEAQRYNDEVDEGEERPDRAEEEKADLRRRARVPVAGPPAGDCREEVSKAHSGCEAGAVARTYRRL